MNQQQPTSGRRTSEFILLSISILLLCLLCFYGLVIDPTSSVGIIATFGTAVTVAGTAYTGARASLKKRRAKPLSIMGDKEGI